VTTLTLLGEHQHLTRLGQHQPHHLHTVLEISLRLLT
jgi:hypothetical protein